MSESETILDQIDTAIWIYDIKCKRIHWGNQAALTLWSVPSLKALRSLDPSVNMSPEFAMKLERIQEQFAKQHGSFVETWTFYPKGQPRRLRVKCRSIRLADGSTGILSEANPLESAEPDSQRGAEALRHAPVMLSLFERDGIQLYCSPVARAMFGEYAERLTNRFVDPDQANAFLASLKHEHTVSLTAKMRRTDGEFWHQLVGVPCRDPVTERPTILISEWDVTDAYETIIALETSKNEAIYANRAKSSFLANMSHEIRTPINGIVGMAEILSKLLDDPEHVSFLNTILDSSEILLSTINDVLDLAKIESGKLDLESTEFRPVEVARRIESTHSLKASEKKISFSVTLGPGANLPRVGDPHRILQIINNLVSNAIKFTEQGSVTVTMHCTPDEPIIIQVSDTGVGMTKEQSERIFEKFVQADTSTTRKYGGAGLGMPILKNLVDAMSGEIELRSWPNEGTTVRISLPLELSRSTRTESAAVLSAQRDIDLNLRVLAAEDVDSNRSVLEAFLCSYGIVPEVVDSGEEAVARVGAQQFDLFLLDISMPGMDGVETLRAIREVEQRLGVAPTPAVAVTANVFNHQIASYLEAGFDDYIAKPLRSETLIACVRRHAERANDRGTEHSPADESLRVPLTKSAS